MLLVQLISAVLYGSLDINNHLFLNALYIQFLQKILTGKYYIVLCCCGYWQ